MLVIGLALLLWLAACCLYWALGAAASDADDDAFWTDVDDAFDRLDDNREEAPSPT